METLQEHHRQHAANAQPNVLKIMPRYDLTLDEVLRKRAEGYAVVYTPHLGNKWREDIYLALQGIPHATVNRNAIGSDTVDMPHALRVGGAIHRTVSAAQDETFTPFAVHDGPDRGVLAEQGWDRYGRHPGAMHFHSTVAALPGADIDLEDEYLFLRGSVARRAADILGWVARRDDLAVFARAAEDGRGAALSPPRRDPHALRDFLDVAAATVRNVREDRVDVVDGPLPYNSAMSTFIAVHALLAQEERGIRAPEGQPADVYTVSGPDMIGYLPKFTDAMNAVYHAARRVHPSLPERVQYHIVPGAVFDFVPTAREPEAEAQVRLILAMEREREDMSQLLREKARPDREDIVRRKNAIGERQKEEIDVFLRMRAALPFHSQYDILASGDTLADIPELRAVPFRRIQQLFHPKTK